VVDVTIIREIDSKNINIFVLLMPIDPFACRSPTGYFATPYAHRVIPAIIRAKSFLVAFLASIAKQMFGKPLDALSVPIT
jgi:hypothetical protein